jgi:hypothetical protein
MRTRPHIPGFSEEIGEFIYYSVHRSRKPFSLLCRKKKENGVEEVSKTLNI